MSEDVGAPIQVRNTTTGAINQLELTNHMHGRRIIRTAKNPLDKCTLVSIFPMPIEQINHSVERGKWNIEAGSYEKPAVLVMGGHSYFKDYDPEQPVLEVPVGSIQLSEAFIKDWSNGLLGCDMSNAMPGLFFVIGEHTSMEIKMKYKQKLDETKVKQDNWYAVLVRLADSLFARTSGNPLAIWDLMKIAATSLNYSDKPWLKDHQMTELSRCTACGSMRNASYPICPTCKSIDNNHPLAKDLKFAI
jgi:hypothetical protein